MEQEILKSIEPLFEGVKNDSFESERNKIINILDLPMEVSSFELNGGIKLRILLPCR